MSGVKEFIVLLLFRICVATAPYNEFMTWDKAKDNCTLATPEFIYDGEIFTVKEDQNMTNDMDGRWLGYFRNMRGFEYFGCIEHPETLRIQSKHIVKNSPGNCFSLCSRKGSVIGLMGHECFCFKTITAEQTLVSYASCNESCPPPSEGLACGGQSFISLYVVNKKVLNIRKVFGQNKNKSNCVRLESDKKLLWAQCDGALHNICYDGTTAYDVPAQTTGRQYFPWYRANNLCFGSNVRPLLYENAVNFNGNTIHSWTGMCRSLSIFTFSEPIIGNAHLEYGYLKRCDASDKYELHFTGNIQEQKKSLCKSDINTSKEQHQTGDGGNSDTDVGLIVGSIVSATLLVVAIVIILFLAKRKIHLVQCCKTKDQTLSFTIHHGPNEHVITGRRNSNEITLPGQISGSSYQNVEAPSREITDLHTYCALENIERGTNNMESEYSQLSCS
ncbi:uncharacterized protein LOC132751572 [Ruditapes philippinarum]|uniref:uncharacterized protein LOC132751572 n=1 Tax=Ruditapes philippinarum TaxID=129788 RepID=UPI00295AC89E|nr:uncharacterized protein LOC132751572 [Ruditapes philippinarum]